MYSQAYQLSLLIMSWFSMVTLFICMLCKCICESFWGRTHRSTPTQNMYACSLSLQSYLRAFVSLSNHKFLRIPLSPLFSSSAPPCKATEGAKKKKKEAGSTGHGTLSICDNSARIV